MRQRSRAQQFRIERDTQERRRQALINVYADGDPAMRERLESCSLGQIIAMKNAGLLDQPPLPGT